MGQTFLATQFFLFIDILLKIQSRYWYAFQVRVRKTNI